MTRPTLIVDSRGGAAPVEKDGSSFLFRVRSSFKSTKPLRYPRSLIRFLMVNIVAGRNGGGAFTTGFTNWAYFIVTTISYYDLELFFYNSMQVFMFSYYSNPVVELNSLEFFQIFRKALKISFLTMINVFFRLQ